MLESYKKIFDKAVEGNAENIYRMEYNGENLVYTKVSVIPKIKTYIEDSLDIKLNDNYFCYFLTEDLDPDGLFSNPAVLCEDNKYYIYNEHDEIPKYVQMVSDFFLDPYPESLDDCIKVLVNE